MGGEKIKFKNANIYQGTVNVYGMTPSKWVYLGNRCIDGSKILQNLVWEMWV